MRVDRPWLTGLGDYVRVLDRGWMQSIAWPIVVEGPMSDANWPARERGASLTLHRLCCLLSLAWNESWQVRESPRDVDFSPNETRRPRVTPLGQF
jgi:hypothetical protein